MLSWRSRLDTCPPPNRSLLATAASARLSAGYPLPPPQPACSVFFCIIAYTRQKTRWLECSMYVISEYNHLYDEHAEISSVSGHRAFHGPNRPMGCRHVKYSGHSTAQELPKPSTVRTMARKEKARATQLSSAQHTAAGWLMRSKACMPLKILSGIAFRRLCNSFMTCKYLSSTPVLGAPHRPDINTIVLSVSKIFNIERAIQTNNNLIGQNTYTTKVYI